VKYLESAGAGLSSILRFSLSVYHVQMVRSPEHGVKQIYAFSGI
jgi:hypothetical protein